MSNIEMISIIDNTGLPFEEIEIHLYLSIGYTSASRSDVHMLSDYFDEDSWNALSEDQKDKELNEIAQEWMNNYLDLSATLK